MKFLSKFPYMLMIVLTVALMAVGCAEDEGAGGTTDEGDAMEQTEGGAMEEEGATEG